MDANEEQRAQLYRDQQIARAKATAVRRIALRGPLAARTALARAWAPVATRLAPAAGAFPASNDIAPAPAEDDCPRLPGPETN